MTRSRKHTPIFSATTAESEKQDKRMANRKLRRAVNDELEKAKDPEIAEEIVMPELREVSDVWKMDKDGKRYWNPSAGSPDYDYDSAVVEELMRK